MQTESHRHPNYFGVFVVLVIITLIEVLISYLPALGVIQVPLLVALSLFKAMLVIAYYMHLKFDTPWYRLIVGFPLVFAIGLAITFLLE